MARTGEGTRRSLARACVLAALVGVPACAPGDAAAPSTGPGARGAVAKPEPPALAFRTQELPFSYDRGETGDAWPAETTGGGVGMLDYDGDGDLDLFFAQGGPLKPTAAERPADCLLRNDGGGRFVDVSAEAGLTGKGYGQGVAVADFDADGDPDVYVTRYGANTLWRNDESHFVDVTAEAGVGDPSWGLGAAFFDYDGDGDLDLFVANYFAFDPALAPFERDPETGAARYGTPKNYQGLPDVLYRNDGSGHFTDVTAEAGVAGSGRGMGCLASDFDGDGRVDLLVANDVEANNLWRNRGDGTFEDVATTWGIAYNDRGDAEANMGIAHGDTDGDGTPDVVITHYFDEHDTLWRGRRGPDGITYFDETLGAGLGRDSLPLTGWGIALADFDQDGLLDFLVTNGHIRPEPDQKYPYENPPILWRGLGRGRFANVTAGAGPYFGALHLGRGLAAGDLDGDGDLDVVVVHHRDPSVILWNEAPRQGHWLMLDLRGAGANRDAIGAQVEARAGGRTLVRRVDGGGGYLSAGDPRVHLGLGAAEGAGRVVVRWPSGRVEARDDLPADAVVVWEEGDHAECNPHAPESHQP